MDSVRRLSSRVKSQTRTRCAIWSRTVRNMRNCSSRGPCRLGGVVKRPIEGLEREGIEARTMLLLLVTHDNGIVDADLAEKGVEALG